MGAWQIRKRAHEREPSYIVVHGEHEIISHHNRVTFFSEHLFVVIFAVPHPPVIALFTRSVEDPLRPTKAPHTRSSKQHIKLDESITHLLRVRQAVIQQLSQQTVDPRRVQVNETASRQHSPTPLPEVERRLTKREKGTPRSVKQNEKLARKRHFSEALQVGHKVAESCVCLDAF